MNERIAVIVAHIDDAELWAGGTLLKYSNIAKIKIFVLHCDDEVRKLEAIDSSSFLKSEYKYITKEELYSSIAKFRPTIVITHWKEDTHPEHADVFHQVQDLLPYWQIYEHVIPNVYCMETYNQLCMPPCNIIQPNKYIDISNVWEKKLELISVFKSQPLKYWIDMVQLQNQISGRQVGVKYAEAFIQIPVLGVLRCSEDYLKGNS